MDEFVKMHLTRVVSGVRLFDDRFPEEPVYSSKNRCFLGFVPGGGEQILMNENEVVRTCKHGDGTKIKPNKIQPGKIITVYSQIGELAFAK